MALWKSLANRLKPSDDTWTTKDRRVVRIKDMETSHLIHAMQYLERRALQSKVNLNLNTVNTQELTAEMFPVYVKMRDELQSRLNPETPEKLDGRKRRIELD